MSKTNPNEPKSSEITPESLYLNRRTFMRAGIVAASLAGTGLVYRLLNPARRATSAGPELAAIDLAPTTASTADMSPAFRTIEKQTPFESITHYNNFYEFSTGKEEVADAAVGFVSRPWTISIDGLCSKPQAIDLDDMMKISPAEERVYRMRCVEAWSMVIPWAGIPLNKLLERVQPLSSAKYIAFQTLLDPNRMPNQRGGVLDWPYVEGLRIDEAMHPLTILATGIYGKQLPAQNGAPLRLVVPWKYGFKGIKSIVKISLVAAEPPTTWNLANAREYGFYANVNPQVDHPRWSQATERRIGEGVRDTLMFNGYAEQVASMYAGMDLAKYY